MAEISKINLHGIEYDIKDTTARQTLELKANQTEVDGIETKVAGLLAAEGGPLKASTVAEMDSTTGKIYVYTGTESGYNYGHWYYFDGTGWADGGVYQAAAVETDTSLSVPEAAAEAKEAGDRIENNAESVTGNSFSGIFVFPYWWFAQGSLSSASQHHRIHTTRNIKTIRALKCTIDDGFQIYIRYYDGEGTDIANSGWVTGEYTIPAGSIFKFTIARVTESTSEYADVAEFTGAVKIEGLVSCVEGISDALKETEEKVGIMEIPEFDYSSYYDNGAYKHNSQKIRMATPADVWIHYDISTKVTIVDEDHQFAVNRYRPDGTWISATSFIGSDGEYVLRPDCKYKIVIREANNAVLAGTESEYLRIVKEGLAEKISCAEYAKKTYGFENVALELPPRDYHGGSEVAYTRDENTGVISVDIEAPSSSKLYYWYMHTEANPSPVKLAPGLYDFMLVTDDPQAKLFVQFDYGDVSTSTGNSAANKWRQIVVREGQTAGYIRASLAENYAHNGTYYLIIRKNNDILAHNAEAIQAIKQSRRPVNTTQESYLNKPKVLSLLHFSDIHQDIVALQRIVDFNTAMDGYIDDVVCTGDMVTTYGYGMDWWNGVSGAEKILTTIGNHEIMDNSSGNQDYDNPHTMAEAYARYFAPYIENWGAEYSDSLTYYYKDYADSKIRLIMLDSMIRADSTAIAAQVDWLTDALTGARTAGYSVVIGTHFANRTSKEMLNTNFTMKGHEPTSTVLIDAYQQAVQDFMDAGGDFICYLSGHEHKEFVLYSTDFPNQLIICIGECKTEKKWGDLERIAGDKSQDLFNVISLDTYTKTIKIVRIGADRDPYMRHRGILCLKWTDKTVVYSE